MSSFPNRGRIRRNPFSCRNNCSTPLRSPNIPGRIPEDEAEFRRRSAHPVNLWSDPSEKAAFPAGLPGDGAACVPRARHGPAPGNGGNVTAVRTSEATGRIPVAVPPRNPPTVCGPCELSLPGMFGHPVDAPVLQPAVHPSADILRRPNRTGDPATCGRARHHAGRHRALAGLRRAYSPQIGRRPCICTGIELPGLPRIPSVTDTVVQSHLRGHAPRETRVPMPTADPASPPGPSVGRSFRPSAPVL